MMKPLSLSPAWAERSVIAFLSPSVVCSLNWVTRIKPTSSPSRCERTERTWMRARVMETSIGLSWPLRMILSLIFEFSGPRIFSTAWLRVSPCTGSSSRCVMMSLAMMPALAAGVSSIGATTLIRPSSMVTSMPRPPNSPPSSSTTRIRLACVAGCASIAILHPSAGTGTQPGRINLAMIPPPWATGLHDSPRISTRCRGAFWPNRRELSRHLKYTARRTDFLSSSASQSGLGEPRPGCRNMHDISESSARRYLVSQALPLVTTLQGVFGLGRRGGVVGKPRFQLGFDLNKILGLGLEVARMRPLETRLQHPSDLPIGIAEMIVDGRILGLELDGALELFDRLIHVAEPVIGPAQGVDDVAVVGALLDRALDHTHALVEIDALVDPRIAEIVEHVRLIGNELERRLEIGLRLRPLLGALEADAAEIIDHPVRLLGLADGIDALGIDVRTFRELLASAQHIAERHDRLEVARIGCDQLFEARFRLVRAIKRIQVERELDLRIAVKRRIQQHPFIGFVGEFRLLHRLVEIAERKQSERMRGREIERKLQVDEPEILPPEPSKRGTEPVEHLGGARLWQIDHQGELLASLELVGRFDDERMARQSFLERAENLQRIGVVSLPRQKASIALHHA